MFLQQPLVSGRNATADAELLSVWRKPKLRLWARIISLVVVLAFVFPYLTWAFTPASYPKPLKEICFNQQPVRIPGGLGSVEEAHQGDGRLVVYIQDLHCNYEVQSHIAQLIDALAARHGLNLVAVEGMDCPVDVSRLSDIPLDSVKRGVAEYLLREGKLSGPEHYAALGRHPIRLEGIETGRLYRANYDAVQRFLNSESQGYVYDLREMLNEIKPAVYNRELAQLDQRKCAYREGELPLVKYGAYLAGRARRSGVDLAVYPNLSRYLARKADAFGEDIDADRLFGETEELERALRAGLYTAPQQRELDAWERRLDVMEKLVNISATPEELAEFRQNREQFHARALLAFIAACGEGGGEAGDDEAGTLDTYLDQAAGFYAVADERSRSFVDNLLARMQRQGENLSVLVTGGYHSAEVLAELKRRGLSYISIKPRLARQDAVNPYFALLKNRKAPLEKLLAKNQNLFALPSYVAQAQNALHILTLAFLAAVPRRGLQAMQGYIGGAVALLESRTVSGVLVARIGVASRIITAVYGAAGRVKGAVARLNLGVECEIVPGRPEKVELAPAASGAGLFRRALDWLAPFWEWPLTLAVSTAALAGVKGWEERFAAWHGPEKQAGVLALMRSLTERTPLGLVRAFVAGAGLFALAGALTGDWGLAARAAGAAILAVAGLSHIVPHLWFNLGEPQNAANLFGRFFGKRTPKLLPKAEALAQIARYRQILQSDWEKSGALVELPTDKEILLVPDLHSRLEVLIKILNTDGNLEKIQKREAVLVILGDAIHAEGGEKQLREMDTSVEIMQFIMGLKIRNPESVYYLLGNHDTLSAKTALKGNVDQGKEFAEAIYARYGEEYADDYLEALESTPVWAVGKGIAACHAGPTLTTVEEMKAKIGTVGEWDIREALVRRYNPEIANQSRYYSLEMVEEFLEMVNQPGGILVNGHTHPDNDEHWYQWNGKINLVMNDGAAKKRVGYASYRGGKLELVEVTEASAELSEEALNVKTAAGVPRDELWGIRSVPREQQETLKSLIAAVNRISPDDEPAFNRLVTALDQKLRDWKITGPNFIQTDREESLMALLSADDAELARILQDDLLQEYSDRHLFSLILKLPASGPDEAKDALLKILAAYAAEHPKADLDSERLRNVADSYDQMEEIVAALKPLILNADHIPSQVRTRLLKLAAAYVYLGGEKACPYIDYQTVSAQDFVAGLEQQIAAWRETRTAAERDLDNGSQPLSLPGALAAAGVSVVLMLIAGAVPGLNLMVLPFAAWHLAKSGWIILRLVQKYRDAGWLEVVRRWREPLGEYNPSLGRAVDPAGANEPVFQAPLFVQAHDVLAHRWAHALINRLLRFFSNRKSLEDYAREASPAENERQRLLLGASARSQWLPYSLGYYFWFVFAGEVLSHGLDLLGVVFLLWDRLTRPSVRAVLDQVYETGRRTAENQLRELTGKFDDRTLDELAVTGAYRMEESPVAGGTAYYVEVGKGGLIENPYRPYVNLIVVTDGQGRIGRIYLADIPGNKVQRKLSDSLASQANPDLEYQYYVELDPALSPELEKTVAGIKSGLTEKLLIDEASLQAKARLTVAVQTDPAAATKRTWQILQPLTREKLEFFLSSVRGSRIARLLRLPEADGLSLHPGLLHVRAVHMHGVGKAGAVYAQSGIYGKNESTYGVAHELTHHIFHELQRAEFDARRLLGEGREHDITAEQRARVEKLNRLRRHFLDGAHAPLMKSILENPLYSDVAMIMSCVLQGKPLENPERYDALLNEMMAYTLEALIDQNGVTVKGTRITREDAQLFIDLGYLPTDFNLDGYPAARASGDIWEQARDLANVALQNAFHNSPFMRNLPFGSSSVLFGRQEEIPSERKPIAGTLSWSMVRDMMRTALDPKNIAKYGKYTLGTEVNTFLQTGLGYLEQNARPVAPSRLFSSRIRTIMTILQGDFQELYQNSQTRLARLAAGFVLPAVYETLYLAAPGVALVILGFFLPALGPAALGAQLALLAAGTGWGIYATYWRMDERHRRVVTRGGIIVPSVGQKRFLLKHLLVTAVGPLLVVFLVMQGQAGLGLELGLQQTLQLGLGALAAFIAYHLAGSLWQFAKGQPAWMGKPPGSGTLADMGIRISEWMREAVLEQERLLKAALKGKASFPERSELQHDSTRAGYERDLMQRVFRAIFENRDSRAVVNLKTALLNDGFPEPDADEAIAAVLDGRLEALRNGPSPEKRKQIYRALFCRAAIWKTPSGRLANFTDFLTADQGIQEDYFGTAGNRNVEIVFGATTQEFADLVIEQEKISYGLEYTAEEREAAYTEWKKAGGVAFNVTGPDGKEHLKIFANLDEFGFGQVLAALSHEMAHKAFDDLAKSDAASDEIDFIHEGVAEDFSIFVLQTLEKIYHDREPGVFTELVARMQAWHIQPNMNARQRFYRNAWFVIHALRILEGINTYQKQILPDLFEIIRGHRSLDWVTSRAGNLAGNRHENPLTDDNIMSDAISSDEKSGSSSRLRSETDLARRLDRIYRNGREIAQKELHYLTEEYAGRLTDAAVNGIYRMKESPVAGKKAYFIEMGGKETGGIQSRPYINLIAIVNETGRIESLFMADIPIYANLHSDMPWNESALIAWAERGKYFVELAPGVAAEPGLRERTARLRQELLEKLPGPDAWEQAISSREREWNVLRPPLPEELLGMLNTDIGDMIHHLLLLPEFARLSFSHHLLEVQDLDLGAAKAGGKYKLDKELIYLKNISGLVHELTHHRVNDMKKSEADVRWSQMPDPSDVPPDILKKSKLQATPEKRKAAETLRELRGRLLNKEHHGLMLMIHTYYGYPMPSWDELRGGRLGHTSRYDLLLHEMLAWMMSGLAKGERSIKPADKPDFILYSLTRADIDLLYETGFIKEPISVERLENQEIRGGTLQGDLLQMDMRKLRLRTQPGHSNETGMENNKPASLLYWILRALGADATWTKRLGLAGGAAETVGLAALILTTATAAPGLVFGILVMAWALHIPLMILGGLQPGGKGFRNAVLGQMAVFSVYGVVSNFLGIHSALILIPVILHLGRDIHELYLSGVAKKWRRLQTFLVRALNMGGVFAYGAVAWLWVLSREMMERWIDAVSVRGIRASQTASAQTDKIVRSTVAEIYQTGRKAVGEELQQITDVYSGRLNDFTVIGVYPLKESPLGGKLAYGVHLRCGSSLLNGILADGPQGREVYLAEAQSSEEHYQTYIRLDANAVDEPETKKQVEELKRDVLRKAESAPLRNEFDWHLNFLTPPTREVLLALISKSGKNIGRLFTLPVTRQLRLYPALLDAELIYAWEFRNDAVYLRSRKTIMTRSANPAAGEFGHEYFHHYFAQAIDLEAKVQALGAQPLRDTVNPEQQDAIAAVVRLREHFRSGYSHQLLGNLYFDEPLENPLLDDDGVINEIAAFTFEALLEEKRHTKFGTLVTREDARLFMDLGLLEPEFNYQKYPKADQVVDSQVKAMVQTLAAWKSILIRWKQSSSKGAEKIRNAVDTLRNRLARTDREGKKPASLLYWILRALGADATWTKRLGLAGGAAEAAGLAAAFILVPVTAMPGLGIAVWLGVVIAHLPLMYLSGLRGRELAAAWFTQAGVLLGYGLISVGGFNAIWLITWSLLHVFKDANDIYSTQETIPIALSQDGPSSWSVPADHWKYLIMLSLFCFQRLLFAKADLMNFILFLTTQGALSAYLVVLLGKMKIVYGDKRINTLTYANYPTVPNPRPRDLGLDVTIQVPVHQESFSIIRNTLDCALTAMKEYNRLSPCQTNLLVCDDALMKWTQNKPLEDFMRRAEQKAETERTEEEKRVIERVNYYKEKNIVCVARPADNRKGLFKKAGNLQHTLDLEEKIRRKERLGLKYSEAVKEILQETRYQGSWINGELKIHEIILLLDKDSTTPSGALIYSIPEFVRHKDLAYVQCASYPMDRSDGLFERMLVMLRYLVVLSMHHASALMGFLVRFEGHNGFIRKDALRDAGGWDENAVAEDFNFMLKTQARGNYGKFLSFPEVHFKEETSPLHEEADKYVRYQYGTMSLILNGPDKMGDGIITETFRSFIRSRYISPVVKLELIMSTLGFISLGLFAVLLIFSMAEFVLANEFHRMATGYIGHTLFYTLSSIVILLLPNAFLWRQYIARNMGESKAGLRYVVQYFILGLFFTPGMWISQMRGTIKFVLNSRETFSTSHIVGGGQESKLKEAKQRASISRPWNIIFLVLAAFTIVALGTQRYAYAATFIFFMLVWAGRFYGRDLVRAGGQWIRGKYRMVGNTGGPSKGDGQESREEASAARERLAKITGTRDIIKEVKRKYTQKETDEYQTPSVLVDENDVPIGRIQDGDSVVFLNFRSDRTGQLCAAFLSKIFKPFKNKDLHLNFATMTDYALETYDKVLSAIPKVIEPEVVPEPLADVLAKNNVPVAKITETTKGKKHLTFFFNGRREKPYPNEKIYVDFKSPKEPTPEMRMPEVAAKAVDAIHSPDVQVTEINLCAPDMVGHEAKLDKTIQAVEKTDENLGKILKAIEEEGGVAIVTADHGNAEENVTSHTSNPVPFVYIDYKNPEAVTELKTGTNLGDVAPTLLHALNLEKPEVMTGRSLLPDGYQGGQRKVVLIVLDGWGLNPKTEGKSKAEAKALGDAIRAADTPVMDAIWAKHPHTTLEASGEGVGLRPGQEGNSEVGHINMGAGRVVPQDVKAIDHAIEDGGYFKNPALVRQMEAAKKNGKPLHLMILAQEAAVHASLEHLYATLRMAKQYGLTEVYVHAFLDGRDEDPGRGLERVREIQTQINRIGVGEIVTTMGRYWAMDRENNWERTQLAYEALANGASSNVTFLNRIFEGLRSAANRLNTLAGLDLLAAPALKWIGRYSDRVKADAVKAAAELISLRDLLGEPQNNQGYYERNPLGKAIFKYRNAVFGPHYRLPEIRFRTGWKFGLKLEELQPGRPGLDGELTTGQAAFVVTLPVFLAGLLNRRPENPWLRLLWQAQGRIAAGILGRIFGEYAAETLRLAAKEQTESALDPAEYGGGKALTAKEYAKADAARMTIKAAYGNQGGLDRFATTTELIKLAAACAPDVDLWAALAPAFEESKASGNIHDPAELVSALMDLKPDTVAHRPTRNLVAALQENLRQAEKSGDKERLKLEILHTAEMLTRSREKTAVNPAVFNRAESTALPEPGRQDIVHLQLNADTRRVLESLLSNPGIDQRAGAFLRSVIKKDVLDARESTQVLAWLQAIAPEEAAVVALGEDASRLPSKFVSSVADGKADGVELSNGWHAVAPAVAALVAPAKQETADVFKQPGALLVPFAGELPARLPVKLEGKFIAFGKALENIDYFKGYFAPGAAFAYGNALAQAYYRLETARERGDRKQIAKARERFVRVMSQIMAYHAARLKETGGTVDDADFQAALSAVNAVVAKLFARDELLVIGLLGGAEIYSSTALGNGVLWRQVALWEKHPDFVLDRNVEDKLRAIRLRHFRISSAA